MKCYRKSAGSHVDAGIGRMTKQELLATIRDRYRASSKKDKSRILDEFIAVTGHHRKHGIRPLGKLDDYGDPSHPVSWTFRISSGVSQGIDKSVVQSDWEFLRMGVDGRR